MYSSLLAIALVFPALVSARFANEQKVGLGGKLGEANCVSSTGARLADQFSGQEIAKLLAAAGACDKLVLADQVVAKGREFCGGTAAFDGVVAAALLLVQAEHNFNPFVTTQDIICNDASLPKEDVLRGIVQLVDPSDASPNNADAARTARAKKVNDASARVFAAAVAAKKGPGFAGSMAELVVQNGLLAADIKDFKATGQNGGGNNGGNNGNAGNNNGNAGNNNGNTGNGNNAGNNEVVSAADATKLKDLLAQAVTLLKNALGTGAATGGNTGNTGNTGNAGGNAGNTGNNAVGNCNAKSMEYIVVGNEHRFGLDGAQVALNPAIPAQRICDALRNAKASATCIAACDAASATLVGSGAKGFSNGNDPAKDNANAKAADAFNKALGKTTNFAAKFPANGGNNGGNGGGAAANCNAKKLEYIVQGREHRFGFDGRQVALNPAIPIQNICQQVSASCQATCTAAGKELTDSGALGFSSEVANAAKDRSNAAAADKFNAKLGNKTNFAANF